MKPVSEMIDSELDEALALLRGWHKGKITPGATMIWWMDENDKCVYSIDGQISILAWHPTQSLDQCHEIEGYLLELPDKIAPRKYTIPPFMKYREILQKIIQNDLGSIIHATARQKAEALYLTLKEVEK